MERRNGLAEGVGNAGAVIRPANIQDMPEIISIGRKMLENEMPDIKHTADYLRSYVAAFMEVENRLALVLEIEGTVTGFILASIFPSPLSGELVGVKNSWVMKHKGQGMILIRAAEAWAAAKGAKTWIASLPGETSRKVMERMGYKMLEINYEKPLA
jgi:N-acetylglutamate synthase-like GNAT family acetyltransferase